MKVAVHQPQYLPWLPYFLKIENADLFIFLDTVAFQKNGIQNRNKIKTAQGGQWLTVPVRQNLGQKIVDTPINNQSNWRHKHWQTIRQCYGKTLGFLKYQQELKDLYLSEWHTLGELNIELTKLMLKWMGIETPIVRSSELKSKGSASELVLNLCLEVGADIYMSGTGGMNYLDESMFSRFGLTIEYNKPSLPNVYPQQNSKQGFVKDLSALDIVLNCDDSWRNYLPEREDVFR
jgi:hypothetical protein